VEEGRKAEEIQFTPAMLGFLFIKLILNFAILEQS
jgi:hypothetical protein